MKRISIDIPNCEDCDVKERGILCLLSRESKMVLSDGKGQNFFKKGQVIFYEGNHVNGLYCIYKGKVKLTKLGESGKEHIVRFAKASDILGYRSLLSNEAYHATATAIEDCWICIIPKEKVIQLMREDPKLSLDMLQLLSKDLKTAEQLLLNVSQKTVLERVAESIIILQRTFGYEEDGKTVAASLTRSEIADIAGTTTETTIRMLSQMNDEGVIKIVGKKIEINNLSRLIQRANIHY